RRAHLAAMLNRYVAEVETIIGRLSQGELAEASQLPKVKREMMSVSKALREAEIEIEQERKRDESRRGDTVGAIDMGRARDALRRRLDSLRDARGAGRVS
ncbi:MAG: hypothetical protein AAGA15_15360, partial [Pseudomonadota bacterium]